MDKVSIKGHFQHSNKDTTLIMDLLFKIDRDLKTNLSITDVSPRTCPKHGHLSEGCLSLDRHLSKIVGPLYNNSHFTNTSKIDTYSIKTDIFQTDTCSSSLPYFQCLSPSLEKGKWSELVSDMSTFRMLSVISCKPFNVIFFVVVASPSQFPLGQSDQEEDHENG